MMATVDAIKKNTAGSRDYICAEVVNPSLSPPAQIFFRS